MQAELQLETFRSKGPEELTSQKNDELSTPIFQSDIKEGKPLFDFKEGKAPYVIMRNKTQYDIEGVEASFQHPRELKPHANKPMIATFLPLVSKTETSLLDTLEALKPSQKNLESAFEGWFSFNETKEYSRVDDEAGMRILSSPLFNAFSANIDFESWTKVISKGNIARRLRQVRPSSNLFPKLAKELFKMAIRDQWLHDYLQSVDFDGSWMAIICGFYQSLYLYHTQIVESHGLSRPCDNQSRSCDNHSLASNEKIVVLILRLQHLQTFQRIVAIKLQKHPFQLRFEILGSQQFLKSCLLDSLQQTRNDLLTWEEHIFHDDCVDCGNFDWRIDHLGSKYHLAYVLPKLVDIDEDKWLWEHLHLSVEAEYDDISSICASLHQGLYLYGKNNDYTKAKKMAEERLTVLLFRSIHLKYFKIFLTFELPVKPSSFLHGALQSVQNNLLKCSEHVIDAVRETCHSFLQRMCFASSFSQKEKQESHGHEDASSSQRSINFFLGTKLYKLHEFSPMIEDPLDLKQVHNLGGLICTIEGESSTSSSGEGLACTSWCIVRHAATNLFFCVDLKNDVYENKNCILDGETTVDYEGVIEVEIEDGHTFVRSLENDGSSYNGCLEDFVDMRGDKKAPKSCAEEALHNLPQSDCLKKFNLKCSVLHMLALAFLAGNKECLTLKWGDGAGHIEYFRGSSDQAQDTTDVALRKCTVMYTDEGRLIGEDIIWEGRDTDPQDRKRKSICTVEGKNTREERMDEEAITEEERDKVDIILEHSKSWSRCSLIGDYPTLCPIRARGSLIRACKEAEKELVPDTMASALAQLKQNSGFGIGVGTVKLQGNHEYRPHGANAAIKRFLHETNMVKHHLKTTVVVPRDLHNDTFNNLKALLKSGRIGEHPREFFILKTKGSCSLQVFLCDPKDFSQEFIWVTDIVMSDSSAAEEIFNDKLKGKSLTISRKDSELFIDLNVARNSISRFFQRNQQRHLQVVREETMIHKDQLQNFPPSRDAWKFLIGNRRGYNEKNYFLKATEYEAIVCSGTTYTTGGAIVRKKEEIRDASQPSSSSNSLQNIHDTSQPSTSSNFLQNIRDTSQPSSSSNSQELINCLVHGSCEKVCSSLFETEKDEVTTVGKFSTFKGISFWPPVYWG